ncbi:MAG: hypothetical protein MZU84_05620 [Sphingobacterium sp.]|nr:hypothetical protein [Sphingobacterium sp.]
MRKAFSAARKGLGLRPDTFEKPLRQPGSRARAEPHQARRPGTIGQGRRDPRNQGSQEPADVRHQRSRPLGPPQGPPDQPVPRLSLAQRRLRPGRNRSPADERLVGHRHRLLHDQERPGDHPQGGWRPSETAVRFITAINRAIQDQGAWLRSFIGAFLLFTLLLVTLWYYLRSLLAQPTAVKYFRMMMLTIFVSLLLYKLVLFLAGTTSIHTRVFLFSNADAYKFLLPFSSGPCSSPS